MFYKRETYAQTKRKHTTKNAPANHLKWRGSGNPHPGPIPSHGTGSRNVCVLKQGKKIGKLLTGFLTQRLHFALGCNCNLLANRKANVTVKLTVPTFAEKCKVNVYIHVRYKIYMYI